MLRCKSQWCSAMVDVKFAWRWHGRRVIMARVGSEVQEN
jgi:hypothetical protein